MRSERRAGFGQIHRPSVAVGARRLPWAFAACFRPFEDKPASNPSHHSTNHHTITAIADTAYPTAVHRTSVAAVVAATIGTSILAVAIRIIVDAVFRFLNCLGRRFLAVA